MLFLVIRTHNPRQETNIDITKDSPANGMKTKMGFIKMGNLAS